MSGTPLLANDKYRATLRSDYIDGVDTVLAVTSIPANLPTQVVVGWNTQFETVFTVTGTSGTNSSNYTLTGITKLRGFVGNIPTSSAVNCLNNQEFFNQYSALIAAIQATADAAANLVAALDASGSHIVATKGIDKRVASTTSSATPAPNINTTDLFDLSAQAATAAFQPPTGSARDGQTLIVRITDNGSARGITWSGGTGGFTGGGVPLPSNTVTGKISHIGLLYVTANAFNKWMCVAVTTQP